MWCCRLIAKLSPEHFGNLNAAGFASFEDMLKLREQLVLGQDKSSMKSTYDIAEEALRYIQLQ